MQNNIAEHHFLAKNEDLEEFFCGCRISKLFTADLCLGQEGNVSAGTDDAFLETVLLFAYQSLSCDDFSCGILYSTHTVCIWFVFSRAQQQFWSYLLCVMLQLSGLQVPTHCTLHPALRVSCAELWVGKCQHQGQIPRKWDYQQESDRNEGQIGKGGLVLSPKQFSLGQESSSVWKADKEVLEKAFCHVWWAEA